MSLKQIYTEEDFVRGLQKNDGKVLAVLYKTHFQAIQYFIINNKGSEQDAKDVFQEAFMILYEQLQTENFVLECKIKTYLYSVSRRLWLRKLAERRKNTKINIQDTETFIKVSDEEKGHQEHLAFQFETMDKALEELGEPCATIIKDFYLHKKSMQDISEKMGYTNPSNAKTQKYKCLQRLKKIFFKSYKMNKEV